MAKLYFLLFIAGSVLPWLALIEHFNQAGLSMGAFFEAVFATAMTRALAVDLLISAVCFLVFAFTVIKKEHRNPVTFIVLLPLTFLVGLSSALPFFLFVREVENERGV